MTCKFRLSVSSFTSFNIGSIEPDVGLITNQGRIDKVNDKSLVLINEDGDTVRVRDTDYLPNVKYTLLTDKQVKAVVIDEGKSVAVDESIRQLQDLPSTDLIDVITSLVEDNATANAYRENQATIYRKNRGFSDEAKLAFVKHILN